VVNKGGVELKDIKENENGNKKEEKHSSSI